MTNADTWFEIKQTNNVFIVQLNRFVYNGLYSNKINDPIEMPLQFVMNNQCYELFAFVIHESYTDKEGHYIAYSKQ